MISLDSDQDQQADPPVLAPSKFIGMKNASSSIRHAGEYLLSFSPSLDWKVFEFLNLQARR
jgi:hypothetical protein